MRVTNALKCFSRLRVANVSRHHNVDGGSQQPSLLFEIRPGKQKRYLS